MPLRAKASQPAISSAGTITRSSPWNARVSRNAGLAGAASVTEVILGFSRGLLQEGIVHVLLRFRGDVLRNVFEVAHHRGDRERLRPVDRRIRRGVLQSLGRHI